MVFILPYQAVEHKEGEAAGHVILNFRLSLRLKGSLVPLRAEASLAQDA